MNDTYDAAAAWQPAGVTTALGLDPALRLVAARNLVVDQVTADVARAFAAEGIETLVLKGPVLAAWLYAGEVRAYGDSDLLIEPDDWPRAVAVLERLGFSKYLDPRTHPPIESSVATEFLRGNDNVDLHRTLQGLEGDPRLVAASLMAIAGRQGIGRVELKVLDRADVLLNVGLHAAHHGKGKPIEDLRRAIVLADEPLWWHALERARKFDGVRAFASGIKLLPEGVDIARRLGIENVSSTRHELRRRGIQTAEGIDTLLTPGLGVRRRFGIVTQEFFPPPAFMRHWTPLARHGRLGLVAAYLWRAIWLVLHLPVAMVARWQVNRADLDR